MNASTVAVLEDCELCRGDGLCPQCDGYGDLADRLGRSGAACPLCAGDASCPQCTSTEHARPELVTAGQEVRR